MVESAVVKHARASGFPYAQRRALSGSQDQGDVHLDPYGRVVIECKGGKAAETASDSQVAAWLTETERERINAGADYAFLVLKRPGKGVQQAGSWWAVIGSGHLYCLMNGTGHPWADVDEGAVVRMPLSQMLALIPGQYRPKAGEAA